MTRLEEFDKAVIDYDLSCKSFLKRLDYLIELGKRNLKENESKRKL